MMAHCSKLHLCDSCIYSIADCESNNITFGDGKGNDNVVNCDCFNNTGKPIVCPTECVACHQPSVRDEIDNHTQELHKLIDKLSKSVDNRECGELLKAIEKTAWVIYTDRIQFF